MDVTRSIWAPHDGSAMVVAKLGPEGGRALFVAVGGRLERWSR